MAEDQLKKYLLFAEILANYKKITIFFSECVFGLFEQFRNFKKNSIQVLATPYMEVYYVIQAEVGCRTCRPERLKLPAPIHFPIHDRCKDDAPGP